LKKPGASTERGTPDALDKQGIFWYANQMSAGRFFSPPESSDIPYPTRLLYLPGDISRLEKIGTLKKYPKNTVLIEPGQVSRFCYAIKKGCVIGYEYSDSGEERVYDVQMMGSLMLEATLFMRGGKGMPSPVFFKTVKNSELIQIDKQDLLRAMQEDTRLTLDIIESISNKFFSAMDQLRELKCHDAEWRLCNLLVIFSDNYGVPHEEKKMLITEKISQQILSNLLGINRISVTRIMQKLKGMGLVEQINGYYCIPDMEKMKRHLAFLK
jgi:CRP/FNR family transcriptional regulator